MTNAVPLPALDGRDPLGFLAALGLLRLLTEDVGAPAQLSFSDVTAEAVLHGPYADCREIANLLSTLVAQMPDGAVIPGLSAEFPRVKKGPKGGDPMRPARADYPDLVAWTRQVGGAKALGWLAVLVTDLGQDDKGRVALTRYCAPAGQQTVRSYFEKPFMQVRAEPGRLLEALTRWRRVPGVTGEYLDHRVLRSAADQPNGGSSEIGVPGATWLATMALPLMRLTGNGTTINATLWRRSPPHPATMMWPLWRRPLRLPAVTTLMEHPSTGAIIHSGDVEVDPSAWPTLGVFAVAAARRQPIEGRKSAGALTPLPVRTSVSPKRDIAGRRTEPAGAV